ncbi:MAG: type III pantothenate kinase [Candidatus Ancaeobacter aquaticus]|nr:type III pantothenate kinase [Candidatus Ancaeobacter aquaticus]
MNKNTLLTCDIGNSEIHFGVFVGDTLKKSFRISSKLPYEKMRSEAAKRMPKECDSVILGSVVPHVTKKLGRIIKNTLKVDPHIVSSSTKWGIDLKYKNPQTLGVDRLANSIGGFALYGGPLIIVDFGTAITFDVVDGKGNFIGGALIPGYALQCDSLGDNTAQLPKVTKGAGSSSKIGDDTHSCIKLGVTVGVCGAVKEVLAHLKNIKGIQKKELKILATGGHSYYFATRAKIFDVVCPDLTLIGLKEMYKRIVQ